jgi:hypothetical protein
MMLSGSKYFATTKKGKIEWPGMSGSVMHRDGSALKETLEQDEKA